MTKRDTLAFSLCAVLSVCGGLNLPACSAGENTQNSDSSTAASSTGSGTTGATSSSAAGSGGSGGQSAGSGGAGASVGAGGTGGSGGSGGGSGGAGGKDPVGSSGSGGAGGKGAGGSSGSGGAGGKGAGGSGAGGGGQGALVPKLTGLDMFVSCMPIVPPDPVYGSFNASYDNSAGTAQAVAIISSARLVFSATSDWKFSVTPNSSGVVAPGATANGMHMKLNATGTGPQPPCNFCAGMWGLEVTWNVGGMLVTDTLPPMPVQCVF